MKLPLSISLLINLANLMDLSSVIILYISMSAFILEFGTRDYISHCLPPLLCKAGPMSMFAQLAPPGVKSAVLEYSLLHKSEPFSLLFSHFAIRDPNWMARLASWAVIGSPHLRAQVRRSSFSPNPLGSLKSICKSNQSYKKACPTVFGQP